MSKIEKSKKVLEKEKRFLSCFNIKMGKYFGKNNLQTNS